VHLLCYCPCYPRCCCYLCILSITAFFCFSNGMLHHVYIVHCSYGLFGCVLPSSSMNVELSYLLYLMHSHCVSHAVKDTTSYFLYLYHIICHVQSICLFLGPILYHRKIKFCLQYNSHRKHVNWSSFEVPVIFI